MIEMGQTWVVARRELRERGRSRAFRASVAVMALTVIALIAVPSLLDRGPAEKDIGLTGSAPAALDDVIGAQANVMGVEVRIKRYDTTAAGETAVRNGDIDVLVLNQHSLAWRRQPDELLRSLITDALQQITIRERAAAAGVSIEQVLALITPVAVDNVALGGVPGRSPDDEMATLVMTVLLFLAVTTFGNLVLTGVVEEKESRVIEVLLARVPARNLLTGKVLGIGLLGFIEVAVVALAALVAMATTDAFDIPAARGAVIGWAVVWFVLGYALFATVYGALGSLVSRTEDAQSVAAPVQVVLIGGYFASFIALGRPESAVAKVVSFFPPTAPFSMPGRIAMGAAVWWEPVLAAALAVGTILALLELGGRVYAGAVLHSGPSLKLREAWRRA
ncbi:MAG: ABC transporter permease [Acidimicrobiales bacterium]